MRWWFPIWGAVSRGGRSERHALTHAPAQATLLAGGGHDKMAVSDHLIGPSPQAGPKGLTSFEQPAAPPAAPCAEGIDEDRGVDRQQEPEGQGPDNG